MHAQPTRENIAAEDRTPTRFFPASLTAERRLRDACGVFEAPSVPPPRSKAFDFVALAAWYFVVLVTVVAVCFYLARVIA